MTQDEIIEMAILEAEFVSRGKPSEEESKLFVCVDKDIVRFAKLVADKAIAELESQEPYGWVSQHTTKGMYEWQFNKEIAGVYQDTAISILPVYTHPPQRTEQNFCPRCGKRTNDIHTCTPPQRTWVGLTDEEINDIVEDCDGVGWGVAQAIRAKLKEKNT
jgi:hypothetical protein